jgi:hypothetical protein
MIVLLKMLNAQYRQQHLANFCERAGQRCYDLAMRTSQLFLKGRSGLARTFAGACIGTLAAAH